MCRRREAENSFSGPPAHSCLSGISSFALCLHTGCCGGLRGGAERGGASALMLGPANLTFKVSHTACQQVKLQLFLLCLLNGPGYMGASWATAALSRKGSLFWVPGNPVPLKAHRLLAAHPFIPCQTPISPCKDSPMLTT